MALRDSDIERILNESVEECNVDYSSDSSEEFQPPSELEESDEDSIHKSEEELENEEEDDCENDENGGGDAGPTARRGRGRPRRQAPVNGGSSRAWAPVTDRNDGPPKMPFQPSRAGFHPSSAAPKSELDFFQLLLTEELMQVSIDETNGYAREKITTYTPLHSHVFLRGLIGKM